MESIGRGVALSESRERVPRIICSRRWRRRFNEFDDYASPFANCPR